jgi:hypothetical protein
MSAPFYVVAVTLVVLGLSIAVGLLIAARRGLRPTSRQAAQLIGLSVVVVAGAVLASLLPSQPSAVIAILAVGWIVYRASTRALTGKSDLPVRALMAIAVTAAFAAIVLAVATRQ